MTQEALKLALDFIEDVNFGEWRGSTERQEKAITAIKEALAQEKALQALHSENERLGLYKDAYAEPKQEPVAVYGYCPECGAKGVMRERRPNGNDKCANGHTYPSSKSTPPQPEQEPVGDDWTPCMKLPVVVYVRKQRLGESHVSTREGITPVKPDDLIMRGVSGEEYPIGRAIFEQTYSLNTAPPQRTWVGLTDEDISKISQRFGIDHDDSWTDLKQAIEAKLKERNDHSI